ncbi:MAG: 4Fe-4S binding protein [bacterium]|nr:4Fe-4S binding protein [bacterium]
MRLNHFLSFPRASRRGSGRLPRSRLYGWAQRFLPGFLFSDGKKTGFVRRCLQQVGVSWQSSPFRRLIQTLCFMLFCVLFYHAWWPYSAQPDPAASGWPSHYADDFIDREFVEGEIFLALDPLLSISTAIAARTWIWSLAWAAVMLGIGILVPRGFCGYVCPLGTLIDLFDWAVGRQVDRFRVQERGWWVHLKYYLLAGTLLAAAFGVLVSGFVAAIPVITRGFVFVLAPLQLGLARGWYQVPPLNAGHFVSILLFVGLLLLGFLRPRFWCRYVCPTGAVFSVGNLFASATERKVESACIDCGKCVEVCPFDAIKEDFTTRTADCTQCQTCAGVCPPKVIKFVERWNGVELKDSGTQTEIPVSRRGFLGAAAGGIVAVLGIESVASATEQQLPVRPPMSVPENEFLDMCIRCGACFKVCPNSVLQPQGFSGGLDGLWTPRVVADWSGCEPSCNNCGQICPTGAIRALGLDEKRVARMGLAEVKQNCLPLAGEQECQLCVDECNRAGYEAIEFERVHPQIDAQGFPVEGTGFAAPVVVADKCVGCGLCQSVCHRIQVKGRSLLAESAIVVYAGPGKEDRILRGTYTELRQQEQNARKERVRQQSEAFGDFF